MKTYRASAFAAALCVSLMPMPADAEPHGLWLTQKGDAKIRISRCGPRICGTITWLKDPIDSATGRPQVDDKNPDPGKRRRPIIGLRMLSMAPSGAGKWSGAIYNADDGKTYSGSVLERSANAVDVEGCVAVFCGSERWTRTR